MMINDGQKPAQLDAIEEELRDFLAADLLDVPVDPEFKERLKRDLWEIVERNAAERRVVGDDVDPETGSEPGSGN